MYLLSRCMFVQSRAVITAKVPATPQETAAGAVRCRWTCRLRPSRVTAK